MKQKLNKTGMIGVLLFVFCSAIAADRPSRISSRLANLGEVHKIFLAQGLASIVQLPYPVTEAKVGNPDEVQVQVSKTLPSELTLVLRQAGAQPTNLIVRCGARTFVMDLIPSRKTHQDLVRISGSYGAPEMADMGAVLIDSSQPVTSRSAVQNVGSDMVLIDSSAHESSGIEKLKGLKK